MSEQSQVANEWARQMIGALADGNTTPATVESDMETAPPPVTQVELPGRHNRDLADFAQDLGRALADRPIFRREDVVVTVDNGSGEVKPMTPERFLTWVSDHAFVCDVVTSSRGGRLTSELYRRTMPLSTAKGCLQSDRFLSQLRPIIRVNPVRMPVFREGRPELLREGYDEATQIYTLSSGVQINESLTIENARAILDAYLADFGFVDARSKAVAVTMQLALFGIGLQKIEASRLGFMVRANAQGGGKSLLAQMAITPTFGLPENTAKATDEELRKVLDSVALQGLPYLLFDNLKGHFENAMLEGFVTSPMWRARVMGTQRFFRGKVGCVVIVTGNNLTVSPDFQRRMLQCDLFVEEFDLQEKRHARDLNPVVLNQPAVRGDFLSALWAMIRHWYSSGRPPAGDRSSPYRVPTFAEWSDIFGGIVQAAGYENPLVKPADDNVAAQHTLHQRRLVSLLSAKLIGSCPALEYEFQELIDCCFDNELFAWKMKGRERSEDGEEWFEADPQTHSVMGGIFTREMGGRIFTLEDGRRVRFRKRGEGRAKRYVVELIPPQAAASLPSVAA